MHCSVEQQHRLAKVLVDHIGNVLLTHEELAVTARARVLSPLDLHRRCLVKGKVKLADKPAKASRSSSRTRGEPRPRALTSSARCVTLCTSRHACVSPCSSWRCRDDAGDALQHRLEKVSQFASGSKLNWGAYGLEDVVRRRRGGIVQWSGGVMQRRSASLTPPP
eukprot:383606-Prymnesium_polylepis.1